VVGVARPAHLWMSAAISLRSSESIVPVTTKLLRTPHYYHTKYELTNLLPYERKTKVLRTNLLLPD
jgi:hypothetical protein